MADSTSNSLPNRGIDAILASKDKYDPLKSLYNGEEIGARSNHLFFPLDVESLQHWIAFRVFRYNFKRNEATTNQKESIANIFLPIPQQLGTGYKQNYGVEELGPLGASMGQAGANIFGAISQAVNGNMSGLDLGDKIKNEITGLRGSLSPGAFKNLAAEAAEKDLGTIAGAAVAGPFGAVVGALAERSYKAALASEGVARNPHMAILYSGPEFRSHTFQYKLIAKSHAESNAIKNLITAFKYYMAPDYNNGGHFFSYPEQFEIDFRYPDYLFNIGPSVLTGFDVNYHGEGQAAYHHSKAPVSVTISLSFLESTITTKQEVLKYNR